MSLCNRSTRRSAASVAGFSTIELLISMGIIGVAMAATSGMYLASRHRMRDQQLLIETTQAARASLDLMLRDLRLGGACLPVTGDFIALEGVDNGITDTVVTRTGLARSDLSCVRSATLGDTLATDATVAVENANGFEAGLRAYIRHPNGTGEFFTIDSVDAPNNTLYRSVTFGQDYPATSGVYGIDERRFQVDSSGDVPVLTFQLNDGDPSPFAVGIESLDVHYQLKRNCPPCDQVDLPATAAEWAIVEQLFLTVTARSDKTGPNGDYFRRTLTVGVKPRNLLPR